MIKILFITSFTCLCIIKFLKSNGDLQAKMNKFGKIHNLVSQSFKEKCNASNI